MIMKLYLHLIYIFCLLFCFIVCEENSNTSEAQFNLQNHLTMMMKMKTKTKNMLENLYFSANHVEKKINSHKNLKNLIKSKRSSSKSKSQTKSRTRHESANHFSDTSNFYSELKTSDYLQYRYLTYQQIMDNLYHLANQYPKYLKVTTAQKLYNLPNPGGFCNPERTLKCEHYIAFLTNHNISSHDKHQIYISGEVHGDERVGPTATMELISLMLENKDLPWFKYLLDTRYIVLTPMTNPHGYYEKVREELLTKDEDSVVMTHSIYDKTHKDINRDFPYLTKPESCMETIGARVVNELYLNHLFSLSLSMHGGTESLTYPYGTPNHINNKKAPKLNRFYKNVNGKMVIEQTPEAMKIIQRLKKGKYDYLRGKSTNPPDYNAVKNIAETASDHSTDIPGKKYKTGDMNGEVYSVTGGMEDWAYSGSWEGYPIITQPCRPFTYKGYEPEKTMYDEKHKDSLKSIMFLLEVSNRKFPEERFLGRKNLDCLINLKSNAFFNNLAPNRKICLDDYIDGYIPRIIRLSLTLIDILNPYISYMVAPINRDAEVKWTVGGAITVDSTYIIYDYFKEHPDEYLINRLNSGNIDEIKKLLKSQTKELSGKAIWDINYSAHDRFSHIFEYFNDRQYLVFVVVAKVDKNWSLKNNPDPDVNPQTHIANLRNDPNYVASNGKYTLRGQDIFKSPADKINFNKIK